MKVEEIDENTCRVSSNITTDLKGIAGFFLGSAIKKNFSKTLYGFINDWKVYAETGMVSEKKLVH